MKKISKYIITILFFYSSHILSQHLVQDTLLISFKKIMTPLKVPVERISDNRGEDKNLIGRAEKEIFLFIPVDIAICSDKPLPLKIYESLPISKTDSNSLNLRIEYFWLSKNSGSILYPHYKLNAYFSIFRGKDTDDSSFVGQLVYETKIRKPLFREDLKCGYESVIEKWENEFVRDLMLLTTQRATLKGVEIKNFRDHLYRGRYINMLTVCDIISGNGWWISDFNIFFLNREASNWLIPTRGYELRYRNTKDYDSIEFGISVERIFYRIDPSLMLRFKSNFMFGINRWKNIEKRKHSLYDIFIGDISMSQSIIYNRLDKISPIVGIGLFENMTYIYSKKFMFSIGLLINFGIKL